MALPPYTIGFYQNENYYPLGSYLVFLCFRPYDQGSTKDESMAEIEYHILFKGDIDGLESEAICYSGTAGLYDSIENSPRLTAEYQATLFKTWLYEQVMGVLNIKANTLWSGKNTPLSILAPTIKECGLDYMAMMDLYTFNHEYNEAIQKIGRLSKITQFATEMRKALSIREPFKIDHRTTD